MRTNIWGKAQIFSHIWLCNCSHLNLLGNKILFYFLSVYFTYSYSCSIELTVKYSKILYSSYQTLVQLQALMSNYNKIFKRIVDCDSYMIVRRMTRTERTARMTMMAVRRISSLARLGGSSTSMAASPPRFRFMSPGITQQSPLQIKIALASELV